MISLLKYLEGPWEQVRGYLKEDLEHLQAALNQLQTAQFGVTGTLQSGTIAGDDSQATRYVANTGPDHAPKWDQVNLANGVTGRLAYSHLQIADASTFIGRRAGIAGGDYEAVTVTGDDGVEITTGGAPELRAKVDTTTVDFNVDGELEVIAPIFKTIAVSGQSDVVADAVDDTLTLVAGTGITITTVAGTDSITINATGTTSDSFKTIQISGQSDVVADSSADTLTLVAGTGITLTTNAGTDTITIAKSADTTDRALICFSAAVAAGHSPADATTYLFGLQPGIDPLATASGFEIVMPYAGTIARAAGNFLVTGTLGSNENVIVSAVNITATTAEAITSTLQMTATSNPFSNNAMTLAFSAGDRLHVKFLSPTWTTNPTGVLYDVTFSVTLTL